MFFFDVSIVFSCIQLPAAVILSREWSETSFPLASANSRCLKNGSLRADRKQKQGKSYLLHYVQKFVQSKKLRSQYFTKFTVSSKRRFSI